jgi:hypothetical protein
VAKIFGGSASRLEMYGLFVAAVILIGGGISGAVVLTSSDSKPAEVAQPAVEAIAESVVPSVPSNPRASAADGNQSPIGAGSRTTPSIAGLSESEAQIVQDLINRETEAQRLARLQREREDFAAAHPVARYENTEILSCTQMPVYDRDNPGRVVDTAILVKYRITYEAFHRLHAGSAVNPGLPVYQTSESHAREMIESAFGYQAPQVQLQLSPGRHSIVFYGLAFLSNNPVQTIQVRISPEDMTYGFTQFDLPSIGPICA